MELLWRLHINRSTWKTVYRPFGSIDFHAVAGIPAFRVQRVKTILLDASLLKKFFLKTLDKIMGFSYICIYFITCSDTNYLHTQILKNSEKLIAIVNAKVFIYGALKLLSRN